MNGATTTVALRAIETGHLADPVAEMVPVRLGEIVGLGYTSISMLPAAISCRWGFQK